MHRIIQLVIAFAALALSGVAAVSEYHGQVTFGGLPAPGATVTAIQGGKQFVTSTDQQGLYSFPDLTDGKWTIEVEMTGFSMMKQDVVIGPNTPAVKWELKLLPLDQIRAKVCRSLVGLELILFHAGMLGGYSDNDRDEMTSALAMLHGS